MKRRRDGEKFDELIGYPVLRGVENRPDLERLADVADLLSKSSLPRAEPDPEFSAALQARIEEAARQPVLVAVPPVRRRWQAGRRRVVLYVSGLFTAVALAVVTGYSFASDMPPRSTVPPHLGPVVPTSGPSAGGIGGGAKDDATAKSGDSGGKATPKATSGVTGGTDDGQPGGTTPATGGPAPSDGPTPSPSAPARCGLLRWLVGQCDG